LDACLESILEEEEEEEGPGIKDSQSYGMSHDEGGIPGTQLLDIPATQPIHGEDDEREEDAALPVGDGGLEASLAALGGYLWRRIGTLLSYDLERAKNLLLLIHRAGRRHPAFLLTAEWVTERAQRRAERRYGGRLRIVGLFDE
jgi:hypothetical protein